MYKRSLICISLLLLVSIITFTKDEEYVDASAKVTFSDGERRVEELLKALELGGIRLEEETGDGSSYQKRYYCSNVCIDLLSDGSVRYLSDINDADGDDRFLKWLYKGGNVKIISESNFYGFILRNLRKGAINCQICIEQGSGRVVAARIIFNS